MFSFDTSKNELPPPNDVTEPVRSCGSELQNATNSKGTGGDCDSNSEHSTLFPCLHDATVSKYRSCLRQDGEMQLAMEHIASLCLDSDTRNHSDSVSSGDSYPAKDCSASFEGANSTLNGKTATVVAAGGRADLQEGGMVRLQDEGCEGTVTRAPSAPPDSSSKAVEKQLLGESWKTVKAVHEALKEVEDVHRSDELMHFEFFGPFWELSEV
jgi:hypothetical protein